MDEEIKSLLNFKPNEINNSWIAFGGKEIGYLNNDNMKLIIFESLTDRAGIKEIKIVPRNKIKRFDWKGSLDKKYGKPNDGKVLWCWECKRKIKKGELIYPFADGSGKFICKKCKLK